MAVHLLEMEVKAKVIHRICVEMAFEYDEKQRGDEKLDVYVSFYILFHSRNRLNNNRYNNHSKNTTVHNMNYKDIHIVDSNSSWRLKKQVFKNLECPINYDIFLACVISYSTTITTRLTTSTTRLATSTISTFRTNNLTTSICST